MVSYIHDAFKKMTIGIIYVSQSSSKTLFFRTDFLDCVSTSKTNELSIDIVELYIIKKA